MKQTKVTHYKTMLADYLRELQQTAGKAAVERKKGGENLLRPRGPGGCGTGHGR